MADRPQLNSYNPAEPFIKAKLEGHFIDRLLNAMVETGVPTARALKYFHDEPEGNAGHFLSLLLDDFIPFKYTAQHGGDWKDYAKEAVLIGMPMKSNPSKLKVNKELTNSVNASLLREAEQEAATNPGIAERLRELAREEPISYNSENAYAVANLNHDLHTHRSDVIYGQNTGRNKQSLEPLLSEFVPDWSEVGMTKVDYKGPEFFDKWQDNWRQYATEGDVFTKELADEYYNPDNWHPSGRRMVDRIAFEPTNTYKFTDRQLRQIADNTTLPSNELTNMLKKDLDLGEIRKKGFETEANNIETNLNKLDEINNSTLSNEEKSTQRRLILENIIEELNMINLLND